MSRLSLYLSLLLSLFSFQSRAEGESRFLFSHLGVEDGLSDRIVNCIEQDSEGFIWFGTENGLDRYDGYDMVPFMTDDGKNGTLIRSSVNCMLNDTQGRLWIGTRDGLEMYDPAVAAFVGIPDEIDSTGIVTSGNILIIFEDSHGQIWLGTKNGLAVYDVDNASVKNYNLRGIDHTQNRNIVRCIAEDFYGRLWIGTFDGLFILDSKSGNIRHVDVRQHIRLDPDNNLILSLEMDPVYPDILWVGTETGMHRLDIRTEKFLSLRKETVSGCFSNNVIKCIHPYSDSHFMIGTDYGFDFFSLDTYTSEFYKYDAYDPFSISSNVIWDILEDRDGNVWIATENGVSRILSSSLEPEIYRFPDMGAGPEMYGNIIGIVTDVSGDRLIALQDVVLRVTPSGSLLETYRFENATDMKIRAVHVDKNGRLWVGTTNSLWYKDRKDKLLKKVNISDLKYVYCIRESAKGDIWLNSDKGVVCIKNTSNLGDISEIISVKYEIGTIQPGQSFSVSSLGLEADGRYIWIGTSDYRIYRLDTDTGIMDNIKFCSGEKTETQILDFIYSDRLYVITRAGMFYYDEPSACLMPVPGAPIGDNIPNAAVADAYGNIWVSTYSGFIRHDVRTEENMFFDLSDYLDNGSIERRPGSLSCDASGKIWVSAYNMYISFSPEKEYVDQKKPELKISSIKVNGTPVQYRYDRNAKPELLLDYAHNTVSVGVSVLDFTAPGNIEYSFSLEGMDKDWSIPDYDNKVTYHSIPSGRYRLMMSAVNTDGIRYAVREITVRVRPPWWQSWYAYTAYIFLIFFLICYSWRMWRSRVRLAEEMRIGKIQSEADAELVRHKERFFTNISHEFRTPLSLIIGPVEELYSKTQDSVSRSQLDMVKSNAERLLRLVTQIMDFSKLEHGKLRLDLSEGDLVSFLKREYGMFSAEAMSRNIAYRFDCDYPSFFTRFDEDKIEKTVYNLLSNAFKYTPSGGGVTLGMKRASDGGVTIYVQDTGIGIPPDEIGNIFDRYFQSSYTDGKPGGAGIGLSMVKDYVSISGGTVQAGNNPDGGALFSVWLPLERIQTDLPVESDSGISDGKPVVLFADDNSEMCAFMKTALEGEYSVILAGNGSDALSKVMSLTPDVIVSDLMMPVMDGLEFCKAVKEREATDHIPFILLTAKADDESMLRGLETGADDYIAKPFNVRILKLRIEKALQRRSAVQEYFRKGLSGEKSASNEDIPEKELDPFVDKITSLIRANIADENLDISFLSDALKMPRQQMYRKVKALTGYTVVELIRTVRMQRAAEKLCQTSETVTEIMYSVGYTNNSYFSRCFSEIYGMSPKEYRRKSDS